MRSASLKHVFSVFLKRGVVMLLLLLPVLLAAQSITQPADRLVAYKSHLALKQASPFANLDWQFVGPTNISGRVTDVAVVAPKGSNYTIYVATASGGIWKTVNEGTTWESIFDESPTQSIGDIEIDPSDSNVIWAGTGENNIFRSSMAGCGIYRSTDAGKTWQYMGLGATHTISRIIIHPTNSDIIYVAASGHEWTDNPERGIYKTLDGGKTWSKVLYVNERTGGQDLVMDPSNPDILYASTWQRIRERWNDPRTKAHYTGSGIHKTIDGGRTWTQINNGLPAPNHCGRIGIDLCAAVPNVVYAFVDNYEIAREAEEGATDAYGRPAGGVIKGATVYRSDDSGATWRRTSEENRYMEGLGGTYGWVFGQMRVDPVNPDKIFVMGLFFNVSEDGGKTFVRKGDMHMDHHALWIDPENTDYMVNGNDGGVVISYDGGENWRHFTHNLPAVQFYNVAVDMDTPFKIYGSIQDHFSYAGPVDLSGGRHNIPAVEFENVPGGEGSRHAIDPTDSDIIYSEGFYGSITRSDMGTGDRLSILPKMPEGSPKLRGQWVAPFIISPHNPRIIYHGMQHVFRSFDRGDTWEKISADLTYNDPEKLGDISYQTLFALSESPLKFGLIYAGTDDGRAWVTRNGGVKWKEITKGLAKHRWISCMEASRTEEGTVYLTQNGKRNDDFAPYIWKSTNFGKTWTSIVNNITLGPVNVLRQDPKNADILYVGTDLGVYVSLNGGKHWEALNGALPTTFVHDLVVHPREDILVAATHGRGMWALDARPVQALTAEVLDKAVHVYSVDDVQIPKRRWMRQQPARITFFMKDAGKADVTITDADGEVLKSFETEGKGYQVVEWDLAIGDIVEGERPKRAKAGEYKVIVKAGGVEESVTFKIVK
ncbi:hypothetical protein KAR48_02630 [bacterium]|nr:hypothetical protein [bacterium]